MGIPLPANIYGIGSGSFPLAAAACVPFISDKDPTTNDLRGPSGNFRLGQIWVNRSSNSVFSLTSVYSSGGDVFATWSVLASSGGGVNTISGNSGTASPSSGNINIYGSNLYETSASGNTITISPLAGSYPITPFVVGPSSLAGYQNIQDALDAAAIVATASAIQLVYVFSGLYIENLNIPNFVSIVSLPPDASSTSTYILGNTTYNNTEPAGFVNFAGLVFITPNSSPAFSTTDSGAGSSNTAFFGCRFGGPGQGTGTNIEFSVGKNLVMYNCSMNAITNSKNFSGTSGNIFFYNGGTQGSNTGSTFDNSALIGLYAQISDYFILTGGGASYFLFSLVSSNQNNDAIALCPAGTSVYLIGSAVGSNATYIVNGNGVADSGDIVYSSVTPLGSSTFDPDLTLHPITTIP